MNVWERRRILNLLRQRVAVAPHPRRPRCGLAETVSQLVSGGGVAAGAGGRSSSDCEIHIDGNLFFWVAGVAGAGLAFLTFQAITMAGRRRRRDTGEVGADTRLADLLWLGRTPTCTKCAALIASTLVLMPRITITLPAPCTAPSTKLQFCQLTIIVNQIGSAFSVIQFGFDSTSVTFHRKDRTIIIVLSGT